MPSSLIPPYDLNDLSVDRNRTLIFSSDVEENRYMINGNTFDLKRVNQQVHLGDIEEWTLKSMDDDEHPFHIHVNDFQVISVNGQPVRRSWFTRYSIDSTTWRSHNPNSIQGF